LEINQIYSVKIFRLNNEDDLFMYDSFLQSNLNINVVDELHAQLVDLIKIRNPQSKLSALEINEKIEAHLDGVEEQEYGVWVCYAWRNMVVHLLDKDEFLEVKTNRNRNKITTEEQKYLSTKKVGIIGLSVGQSVATTLAMERIYGEVRLADFDTLDLSNCNRIRTGVFNLNISKVIITAREILELDPFINVKIFTDGITENNIDKFFTDGGKLDLIIEECDSIDVKVLSRIKAKEYEIPLLMEMSDRGMIDVERYDLEPDYQMFHGRVAHLDLDIKKLQNLSIEQKVQYLFPMIGGESVSKKLLESASEVGKSILTWPQLASAVVLGGGICADVARRIFLNQFSKSGRFYIDLEQLIAD
jgi:molybdopterin/thiamine biosynthesis adenylyltransferase